MGTTLRSGDVLFNDGSTQTSAPMKVYAGQATGDIGTYGLFRNLSSSNYLPGSTTAGSNLRYSNAFGTNWYCYSGTAPAGTWRCMGYTRLNNGTSTDQQTLWLRIS